MTKFISGLKLSETFFKIAVKPIMEEVFPEIEYAAGRLDYGSDLLGFDTPMSMDHGWGPKVTLYLREDQYEIYHEILDLYFSNHLPFTIQGFPTNFGEPLADGGVMSHKDNYPIHHMITITTLKNWFWDYLGVNVNHHLTSAVWLTIPQQRLATLRKGEIFYDGLESLTKIVDKFHWYPHDIWLYLLVNQWKRIDQDAPFIGRSGSVGDALGSNLIAARLVWDLMQLGFLINKTYIPYHKWFGSAFELLPIAEKITPIFHEILESKTWQNREKHLNKACMFFAEEQNKLGITPFVIPEIKNFHNRPFNVINAEQFIEALQSQIKDPKIKALPSYLGSIDQICDNTDVLDDIEKCIKFRSLYT